MTAHCLIYICHIVLVCAVKKKIPDHIDSMSLAVLSICDVYISLPREFTLVMSSFDELLV